MSSAFRILKTTALCLATFASLGAQAQFVKGNEAVSILADGTKKVETPPTAGAVLAAPCPADRAGCTASGWRMVETKDGIQECTEMYARPTTCRPSTYGKEKRPRLWIVLTKGQWIQCQFPDLNSKCVKSTALPYPALQ